MGDDRPLSNGESPSCSFSPQAFVQGLKVLHAEDAAAPIQCILELVHTNLVIYNRVRAVRNFPPPDGSTIADTFDVAMSTPVIIQEIP
jgi:hypothetical protein